MIDSSFISQFQLPPLPFPQEVRAWDRDAEALGLPEILLMENAAKAAFDVIHEQYPDIAGKVIWLIMGSGNNGGDAACLARYLLDAGARPLVLHTKALGQLKGASGQHAKVAKASGVPFYRLRYHRGGWNLPDNSLPYIIIDGLLGIGFCGPLRSDVLTLVEALNSLAPGRVVVALDVPSGLDACMGKPMPTAVRADLTISFAAAKPGIVLPCAKTWTGSVHVCGIGIPAAIRSKERCSAYLLDVQCLSPLTRRSDLPENSFKNTFGHVLILGGAPGYGGAAHLAARAALRTGAGLVTAAAPAAAVAGIKCGWPEIMTLALENTEQHWPSSISPRLESLITSCTSLVVGPGMGRGQDGAEFLHALLTLSHRPPTVFDADALALLAYDPKLFAKVREEDILTPHPGEAGMLLGQTAQAVQADRWAALEKLCACSHGVNVLKGAGTMVRQSASPILICPYDIPQLAVGGSGDVLAGCLGGLLASRSEIIQKCSAELIWGCHPSLLTAGMGVALHALAGRSLAQQWPLRGNTSTETADALPRVLQRIGENQEDILSWSK
ncbi:MAG: NAD(P)H-hydrate dehydratase [Desulfovibrio sp.]|uniref:NAD(P)H-hydrate dehydratase n=1 Tax=Desulfovibrio sp. TaxID=885 RepID=UPI0039E4B62D